MVFPAFKSNRVQKQEQNFSARSCGRATMTATSCLASHMKVLYSYMAKEDICKAPLRRPANYIL